MKTLEIFKELNAVSEEDILTRFPKQYDELVCSDTSRDFYDGQKVILFGNPSKIISIHGGKLIRLSVHLENSKEISCVIYSQPFYSRVLKKDYLYYFFGTYKIKQKAVMISSIIRSDNLLVQNRFKPYYSLPSKVSQANFYALVNEIINYRNAYINNIIPSKYINKYKLEERINAFKDVHIPTSLETINRGLRVFKYEEALQYCLYSLYLKKQASLLKKKEFSPIPKDKINEFILSLPYKLTSDQIQAVREIVLDMDSKNVMTRLLEGDVGTGKTIVAFIALYANYLRGGQGVLLTPTSTLAKQHYLNCVNVFKDYPLRIALLDSSLSKRDLNLVLEQIQDGTIDIIIGTHQVFSTNVNYFNLTLVVEDEQHKFGVEQRNSLVNKGVGVDVLSMSATPIPRTLSLIINSDLEVSELKSFPSKVRSVETKVIDASSPLIDKAIKRALEVHRQVFIVAPKIEGSEASNKISANVIYQEMVDKYGEENVMLMTGKTKKDEQDRIYSQFVKGEKLILVSTSLIEVGVDVKDASLMIVYEANYFGLASLHQLRGRIGRSGEGSLALLVYSGEDKEALDKLEFLASHSNGEEIALYDLKLRGGGDLASYRQSGESSLKVANFVNDYQIFIHAKEDANEILENLDNEENQAFFTRVLEGKKK